ncbi:hypothetical protein VSR82_38050 [Burkholderia sp. JPY481]|uniref:hypothetical protein n=1 Tax=Paraburkholderia sp. EG304 TaxID=3237015 RepID=UPI0031743DDF
MISPQGTDLVRSIGPTNQPAQIRAATQFEEYFERSLIGASLHHRSEIFGRDAIERRKRCSDFLTGRDEMTRVERNQNGRYISSNSRTI